MAIQKAIILGHTGNVGSELVEQISKLDGVDQGHLNPTEIVGLVNSTRFHIDRNGIGDPKRLTNRDAFSEVAKPYESLEQVLDELRRMGLSGEIVFVDVTADKSEHMLAFHHRVVSGGEKMVTANKNPLALYGYADFLKLTNHPNQYRYNASVMAGGDAIPHLQDARNIRDPIFSIEGCFSGTLGYICSELQKGRKLSEIVREAKDEGYTEPHPWDDLNGMDVARKLLILARTAGFNVEMSDIQRESFIPESFGDIKDVERFLGALQTLDTSFYDKIAKANGRVLRYVAELRNEGGSKPVMKVGLREVDADDWMGQLKGTDNMVRIISEIRAPKSSPFIIITKGAGVKKTAGAVRADMARLLSNLSIAEIGDGIVV